ncbi:MAG TPA: polysaccharide deacetylase family protein [Polyangiaceae bacterium]|nr:polysaccharide deacetylase family protein [Polyangiaceae bacterium]
MLNPVRQLGNRLSQGWQAQGALESLKAFGVASKPWLRDGVAELLARVGATTPARFARGALTIVTFHRVLPESELAEYPIAGLVVTPEQLERILVELARHFECGTVIESFRRWRAGGSARPLLGISFDDGALDNYRHARPVLAELGLRASFYIPVSNVEERSPPWHDRLGFALLRSIAAQRKLRGIDFERLLEPFGLGTQSFAAVLPVDATRLAALGVVTAKRLGAAERERAIQALEAALGAGAVPEFAGMMSWDQVRALHGDGHEIGSHSLTHPLLPELSDERIALEVGASRRELSRIIGAPVSSFCYPNGSYDARTLRAVESAGYECAVTTRWGLNRQPTPFELSRCDMDYARLETRHGEFSRNRLMLRLSGLQPGLREAAVSY